MEWADFFQNWTLYKTAVIQQLFIDKILTYTTPSDHLLELGAGSGFSSLILKFSDRKNIVVSDVNPQVLYNIKKTMPFMCLECIDMFDIPRANKSIDCIFHQGLMEHFDDDHIVKSLKEQARVARLVIFDVPNDRRCKKIQEFGNERFLSVHKWTTLVKQAGLYIVEIDGRRPPQYFKYLPTKLWTTQWIRNLFGTTNIFVCASD